MFEDIMGYSVKCPDSTTYWNTESLKCVYCTLRPGHEVTPNCGYDDRGGRHEGPTKPCGNLTFNDGTRPFCTPCYICPPEFVIDSKCNSTTNTKCASASGNMTTNAPLEDPPSNPAQSQLWAVVLAIFFLLVVLSAIVVYKKRRRGQKTVLRYSRRSSFINEGFSPLSAPPANDLTDVLSPTLLSAPLNSVLDSLDVLEELQMLLDPESHGVKNTKHLAALCSFPSTWITYTYSMKESKSPLRAVLEGVTSRHPDWTVGHLANLLRQMERNDAIAVLARVRLSEAEM